MRNRTLDPQRLTKPIKERLDTSAMQFAKPSQSIPQQPKDGRLVQSAHHYRKTKQQMWHDQNRCCAKCFKFMPSPAFGHRHHIGGRGIGGAKRDDSKTVLLCPVCHEQEKPGPQWSKGAA